MRCASTERCGIARMRFVPMMSFEAVWARYALVKRCEVVRMRCPLVLRLGALWTHYALMMRCGRAARCGCYYS